MLNLRYHKKAMGAADSGDDGSSRRRNTAVLPMSFGADQPEEPNGDTTIATNDINTNRGRTERDQTEQRVVTENYVKIFQNLLDQALA